MRPVKRGPSPRAADFPDYRDAFPYLVSRLGNYCSYCERRIATQLAVEHIQPKALPRYSSLEGRWDNYLLACVNCNSTKVDKDVILAGLLLPDRDNTFAAYVYRKDGTIVSSGHCAALAEATLALVGLDKPISRVTDENSKMVAIDRVAQRIEAWATAMEAKTCVDGKPGVTVVRKLVIKLAEASGFFSIWMTVFSDDSDMRNRLIDAFAGTRESGCFDPTTTMSVTPAPNPDALPNGSKA